jgi:hypothetical protein
MIATVLWTATAISLIGFAYIFFKIEIYLHIIQNNLIN